VAERPLAGRVEMPGYVTERDRFALFQRALVLVMPSHTEGFGMPALEAMTAGVPVVAADRGALPEVTAGAARLFEPDDESQLTAILDELLTSAPARDALREAGWTRARAYSWRDSALRLRDAWKLAIQHRRDTRG
jgi:glycosyltransferase involved in cell wall biosynthesis